MKKSAKNGSLALGLLLSVILIAGCAPGRGNQDTAVAQESTEVTAIPVETIELTKSSIDEEVYIFGYLETNDTYVVTPFSAGIVDEILVKTGDYVAEGDLLFQLSGEDLELSEERDVLSGTSNINSAKNNLDALTLSLTQRESDLKLAEISLETAKENYENTLALFESNVVSQSELDSAENTYEQAQISYEQAGLNLQSTQISHSSAQTTYNEALKNYELTVESYDDQKEDLYVTSPISGLVTDVAVQEEMMNNGSTGITIADNAVMLLNVKVMGKYIYDIQEGQSVELTLAYENKKITGTVTDISLTAANGYYPVEISIDNSDKSLVAGTYIEGYIKTNTKDGIYKVKKSVLMQDVHNEDYIYTVNEETLTAEITFVETGVEEDGYIEITGDLQAGDKIIVIGQDYVDEGQPVQIVEN